MVVSSTNSAGPELLVTLDRSSSVPMHVQLETGIRQAVRTGRLARDSTLPATRRLAEDLGLSRGVVVEAYQQLTAEGYLVSAPGGYTRVAGSVTVPIPPSARVHSAPGAIDLRYGRPAVTEFPREAWLRSLRRVLTEAPHERLSYLDGRGALELREALADYLNRVRGTWATPDGVIACNGFAQGWALIVSVLVAQGVRRLAVDDPSDGDARRVAERAGLQIIGVPVTAAGIDVAALEGSGAEAVLLTPAHQFPTGALLSAEGRAGVLAWAERHRAFIIEDDYDAEYRYDNSPVGALQGLAPDRVIYAGTASKTLAPGLRLGWLVAPASLVDELAAAKVVLDRGSPVVDQLAFADFLVRGELDRHLRRMRPFYRRRRDALLSALAEHLPGLQPVGISAGLHVFCWLPADLPQELIRERALARGVEFHDFAPYRLDPTLPDGLILGYGAADEDAIRAGVAIIGEIVREVRAG